MDTRRDSGQIRQPRGAARGRLRPVDGQAADAPQPDGGLLRTYLAGPRRAQAAYDRVCASTAPAGR